MANAQGATELPGKLKMQRGGSEIAETDGEIQFLKAIDLQTHHFIFSVWLRDLRVSALHYLRVVPTGSLCPEDWVDIGHVRTSIVYVP